MINLKQIVSLGIDVQEIKQVHGLIQALLPAIFVFAVGEAI